MALTGVIGEGLSEEVTFEVILKKAAPSAFWEGKLQVEGAACAEHLR